MKFAWNIGRPAVLAANAAFILLLLTGFILMPPFADDLWYAAGFHSAGQAGTSLWDAACDTIAEHYRFDNGRLSNIFFTLFLLLPGWVGNLLSAAAFGASLAIAYRLISRFCGRGINTVTSVVVLVLSAFALPWYDYIYLECYQFNYLMPTALSMWVVSLALSPEGKRGLMAVAGIFIAGVFAGGWHEGFGVPVLVAVVALMVLRPEYRNIRNVALAAGLAAGIIWIFSSPAALSRIVSAGSVSSRLVVVMALHPAFLLLIFVSVMLLFGEKGRRLLSSPLVIVLGISAVVSFGVHIASVKAPRAGWWCEFASVVLAGYMAESYVYRMGRFLKVSSAVLLAVVFAKLAVCDVYAWRYRTQYSQLVNGYQASEDGIVYLDFTPEYASPLIAWMAPSFHIYYDRYQRWMFAVCYGSEDKLPVVIPAALMDASFSSGKQLEGNIPVRRFGDFFVCRQDELTAAVGNVLDSGGEVKARLRLGPVTLESARVFCFFFENSRGEKLALLLPWRIFPLSPLFKVDGIWVCME